MKHTDLFFINKSMTPLFVGDLNSGSNSFLKSGFSLRNFMFSSKVLHIKNMKLSRMTKFILLGVLCQTMKTKILLQNSRLGCKIR